MNTLHLMLGFIGKDVYNRSFGALLERNKRAVGNLIKTEIPFEGTQFEDYIDGMFFCFPYSVTHFREHVAHR